MSKIENITEAEEAAYVEAASREAAAKRAKMLDKVQKLLAKADDPAVTEAEAASFRAGAERIMREYRIAEEEAYQRGETDLSELIEIELQICRYRSDHLATFSDMFWYAARHAGVRSATRYREGYFVGVLVGFAPDVRYAEMLFLSASLEFAANMDPQRIDGEEERLTAYRFRNAGRTRREVAVMLWGYGVDRSVAAHQKVQRWYEEVAAERGTPIVAGRGVSRADYVKVYAAAFSSRFAQRLRLARDGSDGIGGAVVLANRAERVDEEFYRRYPHLRPSTEVVSAEEYRDTRTEAQKARDARAAQKRADELRKLYASAAGRAGWSAGTAAADQVNISGVDAPERLPES